MKRKTLMRAWPVIALLMVGCPSSNKEQDVNTGGEAGKASVAPADRCRTSCVTFAKCQGFPLSGCEGDINCSGWPAEAWRDEVADAYSSCEKTCPSDPDVCVKKARAAAGAQRTVDKMYADACERKHASCTVFENNICGDEALYEESAVVSAMSCLDMQCAGVGTCVEKYFK